MPRFNPDRLRVALGYMNVHELRKYIVDCGMWTSEFESFPHSDLVECIVTLSCAAHDCAQREHDMEEHPQ